MAFSERETIIANPAKKRGKGKANVAKKLTLKQKLHFGTARQRTAAKAALKRKRKPAAKKKHKARTKPNPAPKKKRATKHYTPKKKKAKKRRSNPGEIVSLVMGNPGRKAKKKMATSKKKKRTTTKHHSGPRKSRKSNPGRKSHRRRSNPGVGQIGDLLMLGGGAVIGSTGSTLLTQALLSTNNTGIMGYAGNAAATGVLAFLAHKFSRNKSLSAGIIAGGIGSLIRRVIVDNSLLGTYSAQLGLGGMGDYMAANFVWPQILPDAMNSALSSNGMQPRPAVVVSSNAGGMGDVYGRPMY